ncbi:Protein kinase superfamily protein [Euphorbia peplus]|nr:Protein kinase superfamily protein [Euphorbia peplus]
MKLLVLVILLQIIPFWIFQLCLVNAAQNPLVYSPSPSPLSASMDAFSPGVQFQLGMEAEDHHLKLDKKVAILLFIACGILVLILLPSFGFCIYYWKFYKGKNNSEFPEMEKGVSSAPFLGKFNSLSLLSNRGCVPWMEYKVLENATNNFGDENLLGEGGFGRVYLASLEDEKQVAVKKLNCASDDAHREFENEVDLLCKIHNPNIISLLGYSVHQEMGFIIYELMQNGCLEDILHGPSKGSSLTWHMRLKIALDIARGLEYLHEFCKPPVIHRDLKSSNILLDSNFNAKLSDFGLAVADNSYNRNKLKLSGTVGYVAPEYMLDGELTEKSDVYAFGVVLLELLLGRRPVEKLAAAHCQSIVTWAMPQLTNRSSLPNIVDPVIKDTVDEKYLFQVAAVAVLCVQPEPSYRPLITDVVHSLIPLIPHELGGTLRITPHPALPARNA